MMEEYIKIGRIGKVHGLKGELKLVLDDQFLMDAIQLEALFLEERGKKAPYFIDYLRGKGTLILKLEEIEDRQAGALLTGKDVYARSEDISISEEEINADDSTYGYLTGYSIVDAELGNLGKIEAIEEYPQQELALLVYKNQEFLIPLNDAFITGEDEKQQLIYMELPEGLLE
ncbi:MAG: 16S rRNA processing protein RimM [Aureispira sp.]|nr:16S rRNA processing protein RimM [Aureispira sp.]